MRKARVPFLLLLSFCSAFQALFAAPATANIIFSISLISSSLAAPPRRYSAKEVEPEAKNMDSLYFSRPVAIVYDENNVFVVDSADAEIKVFSKSGAFLYSLGRKGQGPGEFQMPSDMDILGDKVFVADGANQRVQVLDKKGNYLAGFKVPFWPQRILALETERIVLGHIPSGLSGKEKVLHCYNAKGELLWEAMDSYFSEDSVYDMMRNRIFIKKEMKGDFFFLRSSDDRIIRRMNKDGAIVKEIKVTKEYPLKEIILPARGGRRKSLLGFCWNCASDGEKIYLLTPRFTAEKDLEPGRQIAVIDGAGDIEAFIDFPLEITRIAVEGDKVYGLDSEARLRIFAVKK